LESFLFSPHGQRLNVLSAVQEVRFLIQGHIARAAAQNRTQADLSKLDQLISLETTESDPKAFCILDWQFFHALVLAGNNVIITLIANTIRPLHEKWGAFYFALPEVIDKTRRIHRILVTALRRQDPLRAERLMRLLVRMGDPKSIQSSLSPGDPSWLTDMPK
jgi:DNA-binding FadR family transcriptional regulator